MATRPEGTEANNSRVDLLRLYCEASDAGAPNAGHLGAYRKKRWGRAGDFVGWLEQSSLESLESRQSTALYRASGGRESAQFNSNSLADIRDALDFLLYDTLKLEGRFDECAGTDGAYKLLGAGKEFASYLLCLSNPALFGVWNANAERLLRRAGALPKTVNEGPMGIRYLDILEGLAALRRELGFEDFREIDELAFLTARRTRRA